MFSRIPTFFLVLFFAAFALAEEAELSLKSLNPAHPRVLFTEAQGAETARLLKTDADLQRLYASVEREAQGLLKDPKTVEYLIVGPRLLTQSRRCLRRILALGTVYRLTEDAELKAKCFERAMAEIHAAEAFPDWNPSHYLDTAEMTAAFAIAFDWFYADLTAEEKALMVRNIYEKGVLPAQGRKGWKTSAYNWNQVCSGGITMGILAIADEVKEPEKQAILENTLRELREGVSNAMKTFAPDGAWAEGPGYWIYTTLYTLFYINALEGSLGDDFGLCDYEGFDRTAAFQVALGDSTGKSFNFADAGPGDVSSMALLWFADRFKHPEWGQYYLQNVHNIFPLAVWFYRPCDGDITKAPLDFTFRNAEVATFRGAWNDPDAWFLGFKSGSNAVNHSHLELGNFILQKDQVRWVVDLGADNYNLPAYFGNLRWTYYRLSTRGQNTICIDDQNQNPKGSAVVQNFQTSPDAGSCSTDLTDAYRGQPESLTRSVRLDRKNSEVVIRDEIGPGVGENVGKPLVWQFHTRAKIEVAEDGKSAVLTQSNGTKDCTLGVHLTQATNPAARFEVRETTQGPDENPNTGVLRLVISVPVTAENQVLEVKFTDASK